MVTLPDGGVLLAALGDRLEDGGVTLMHRQPLSVFYNSEAAALADGYTAFGPDDICPVSGFVFRFGGARRKLCRIGLPARHGRDQPLRANIRVSYEDHRAQAGCRRGSPERQT